MRSCLWSPLGDCNKAPGECTHEPGGSPKSIALFPSTVDNESVACVDRPSPLTCEGRTMLATITAALLFSAPPVPEPARADKDAPAAKLELFAKDSWYKDQKGDEKEFVGMLSKLPEASKPVGFARVNLFRLTMGDPAKKAIREVYVGDHPEFFTPYIGKKIKLIGKAVDMEVEGQ